MSPSFKDMLPLIRSDISLQETEDSWEKICRSILSFSQLIRASAGNSSQDIIIIARELHRPINSAMKSERTRLSGPATDLIATMASELGTDFEPLLHLFFPTLLLLCARTSKVVVGRARNCIMSIIETTQLVVVMSYLTQSIRDKSVSLRTVAAEGTLACLNSLNPPDLAKEERTKEIEGLIRVSIRDANAEVRKIGKQIYQAYELLLPIRAESFLAPLTPTSKKYLGLSSRPQSAIEPRGHSRLPPQISSSSSHGPDSKSLPKKLVKKVSSPTLPISSYAPASSRTQPGPQVQLTTTNSTSRPRPHSAMDVHMRPAREDKTRANSPQLVPVRPNLPLSRSESAAASTGHSSTSAQLPTYSTSIKPSSVAAPQRVLVNPLPDVPVLSKSYSGPVRVDPRAGRDPGGSSKSVHHRVTSNELSADTVGGLNRTRHESKESNPRSMKVNPTEKPPTVGNGQGPSSTDTISNAATTKMTATSSQAAKLPHYAQPVASSRARSVSASTSVGAITRPPTSRTRTISTSTTAATSLGSTKPLVARTRTISSTAAAASTSAAAVAVVRSAKPKTTNSTDTNVIRSVTSAPGSLKPTWGSSSSYRSVAPVANKRAARSDVPKASSSNGKRNEKQKRPSVVPEELDEVLTAPGIQSGGGTRKDTPEAEERVEATPLEDESTSQVIEVNTESSQGEEQEVSLVMESAATEAHESESPLIDFSPIQERESMQHVGEYSGQKNSKALTTPAAIKPTFDLIPMEPSSTVEPHTNDISVEVTVTSSTPLLPETPVRVQGQNSDLGILPVQVVATPISALLSSIQRGFLFTPATPLSPPDSYLPKETGGSSVMPFPLFSSKSAPAKLAGSEEVIHEHSKYSDGKARQALETLDVN